MDAVDDMDSVNERMGWVGLRLIFESGAPMNPTRGGA